MEEGNVVNKRQKSSPPPTTAPPESIATPSPPPAVDIAKILSSDIPAAIADLEALLRSSVCRAADQSDRDASPSNLEGALSEILGGPAALNAILAEASDSGSSVTIPPNQRILELMDALQPRFVAIAGVARDVRHWIRMSLPRIESGGNFGVDVQDSVSEMARRVEEEYLAKMHLIPMYYSDRIEYLDRLTEKPGFVDSVLAIKKFDDTEFERFRIFAADMKNDYEELLHYVQTNFELIRKPRAAVGNAERASYFG